MQSVHYENGLVQCGNVDRRKARERRAMGRGQTEENVWAHRNDATKKCVMRAEGGEQDWHDSVLICEKLSQCTL